MVAALLHYFLLALFSWMLCEGILHYIVIVRVLRGHAEDKVKFFYLFGWGRYTLEDFPVGRNEYIILCKAVIIIPVKQD